MYKIKTNKHLTLSYKNYLQNLHTHPWVRHWIKGVGVGKINIFLKNWHPIYGPMSFAAKGKKDVQTQDKQTPDTILQKLSPELTCTPLSETLN